MNMIIFKDMHTPCDVRQSMLHEDIGTKRIHVPVYNYMYEKHTIIFWRRGMVVAHVTNRHRLEKSSCSVPKRVVTEKSVRLVNVSFQHRLNS